MIDFAEIERLDYASQDALKRLDSLLTEVAEFAETRSAFEIVRILEQKIKNAPSISQAVDPYTAKFAALALPLLPEKYVMTVMRHLSGPLTDERISIYERLRARLIALPTAQQTVFSQSILAILRESTEPLDVPPVQVNGTMVAPTIGAWTKIFEGAQGVKNPDGFIAQPDVKQLHAAASRIIRHLVHVLVLLANPAASVPTIPTQPMNAAPQAPRPKPSPVSIPPVASTPAVRPTAAPVPTPIQSKPQPAAAPSIPPSQPAAAVPQPIPQKAQQGTDRGPTVASVLEKLKQSQLDTIVAPPTVAHLTPEDEAEIQQHADGLAKLDVGPNVHDTVTDTVTRIAHEFSVPFADEHLERRFASIVTARLKDIRNSADTLDMLTRSVKVGGMGLDMQTAESIVARATEEARKFTTHEGVQSLIEQQQKQVVSAMPKPPKVPIEPRPALPPTPQPVQPEPVATAAPTPVVVKPVTAVPVATPKQPVMPAQAVPVRPTVMPIPPSMPTAAFRPAADRPTVSDIKGSSRLVGPVEELRSLTLNDYRRLGPDALGTIRRLYEKIQQLGKESFSRRAEGIKAWRESEPYKLYVAMGQESLLQAKTMADVIAARQQQNQPALTEQEFSYISELNRKLRF